jgi:hypothetical protein
MRAPVVAAATLVLVGSAGWCLWAARPARAPVAATLAPATAAWLSAGPCQIQTLRASHRGCGLDARLSELEPLLDRPPWTAFSCFEPEPAPSPPPSVELRARGRDGRRRIRLRAGRTTVTVAERPAETALVATHAGQGDVHILALRCR